MIYNITDKLEIESSIMAIEDIKDADNKRTLLGIIEPVLYRIPEEIDFLFTKKRTKRRKFKSYFGKSYDQS